VGAPGWSPLTPPVKRNIAFYVHAVYTSSDILRRCPKTVGRARGKPTCRRRRFYAQGSSRPRAQGAACGPAADRTAPDGLGGAQVQDPSRPEGPSSGERRGADGAVLTEVIGPGPSGDIVPNLSDMVISPSRWRRVPAFDGRDRSASPSRRIGNAPSRPRAVPGHARVSHSGPGRSASRWPTARFVSEVGLARRSGVAPLRRPQPGGDRAAAGDGGYGPIFHKVTSAAPPWPARHFP
jgi:hypothetical protein